MGSREVDDLVSFGIPKEDAIKTISKDGSLNIVTEKRCYCCKVVKSIACFSRWDRHGKVEFASRCRPCRNAYDRERKLKMGARTLEGKASAADKTAHVATGCPKPALKLEPKTESKQRRGKTPDYDNAVLSQAKEFNIAWEALLNRPGLVIREEHKGDVIRQLKRLRTLTNQLINRAEGEAR